ncbi:MAG: preprotein translocase subunit YajC [Holosporaceae bacterium]|jgi:preprotein translocase subunit YajC|nr:preprotein translocase subunit YajC [Holosporaceae bacterium]
MQAQTTATTSAGSVGQSPPGVLGSLTPIMLMVLVFYFLIMRPQQKREAKRRDLVNSIKKGDKILTTSGVIGILHKVISEKEISVEISEGVRIRMLKNSIADVLEKGSDLGKEETEASISNSKTPAKIPANGKVSHKK